MSPSRVARAQAPSNVRQLRAAIERAAIVGSGAQIDVDDLPPEIMAGDETSPTSDLSSLSWQSAIDQARDEAARRYLSAVLRRHRGRVHAAAHHAGVARESFYRLLRKYGIRADTGPPDEDD